MHKNALFLLKNCKKKSPRAGGFAPQPLYLQRLGVPPHDLQSPLRIPGYATAPHHSFNAEYQAEKL